MSCTDDEVNDKLEIRVWCLLKRYDVRPLLVLLLPLLLSIKIRNCSSDVYRIEIQIGPNFSLLVVL